MLFRSTQNFTYSLYPHKDDFVKSNVAEEAYKLNVGLYQVWMSYNIEKQKSRQYINIKKPNVVLDALKLDEDGKNTVIMRMHENFGTITNTSIEFDFNIEVPTIVNLLEEIVKHYEIVDSDGKV